MILLEAALASLVRAPEGTVHIIPRAVTRRPWRAPGGWADVRGEDAVAALLAHPAALLLARAAHADPGAAAVVSAARTLGRALVTVPEPPAAGAAVAAMAAAWCGPGLDDPARRGVAALSSLVARGPGGGDDAVLTLPPRVLARWAMRAWRPCAACPQGGGGVAGGPCARCGRVVPPDPAPAPALAPVVPLRRSA